jgi:hypothetical protein
MQLYTTLQSTMDDLSGGGCASMIARLNQNGRPAATIDCLSSSPINPILILQVNPLLKLHVSNSLSLNLW